MTPTVHANCLVVGTKGLLIRGPSGSGKTSLTDTLIERARIRGHWSGLVSDDRVVLVDVEGRLIATAPEAITGRIEIRGAGILQTNAVRQTRIDLVVDLLCPEAIERLPDAAIGSAHLEQVAVALILCPANDAATSVRLIRWALRALHPGAPDYI